MKKFKTVGFLLAVWPLALVLACVPAETTKTPVAGESSPTVATATPKSASSDWDRIVAEAKKEGMVLLYGEIGPDIRAALVKAFGDRFDIELDVVSGRALSVAQRFLSEDQTNVHLADAFLPGQNTTLTVVKPKGVLAPIAPLLVLPEVTDPRGWTDGKVPYLDKDRTAVPLVASYRTSLVLNSEMVSDQDIQSYQDLLRPQWKGKIIFGDPTVSGAGATWVAFMLVKVMGIEEGTKFLQQLARQEPVISRDSRLVVESVARGKYPIGLGASSQVVSEFQKAQAPTKWAKVREGGIVIAGGAVIALPQKPAHPNAARVFLNWLLTREGQIVFSRGYGHPARRIDVPVESVDPSVIPPLGATLHWLDEEFIFQETNLMTLSKEIFGPLMR